MSMSDYTEVELRKAHFRTSAVTVRGDTTAYALGDRVMLGTSDLSVYECTTAGTSAGSAPTFNTTIGDSTTDDTVVWLTLKQGLPKRPIYIALWVGDPTDAASGGAEVSGGSYARVVRLPLDANWSAASATDGITKNVAVITFPAPTANWGTVTHFAAMDSLTGGKMICSGALTTSSVINNGDTAPSFAADAIVLTYS